MAKGAGNGFDPEKYVRAPYPSLPSGAERKMKRDAGPMGQCCLRSLPAKTDALLPMR